MKTFNDFSLHQNLLQKLNELGFTKPTEIQEKALPLLLSKNNDFHGQAQTGTGKTLAFGLPLLHHIDPANKKTQALIIAPTRELVVQIYQSLQPLARARNISMAPIYGGVSIDRQLRDLKRGLQVIVGTPGRLNDHLRRKSLSLKTAQTLVLDEADIMLDMGFKQEVDEILRFAPEDRNIWLFSATVKPGINELMKKHMNETVSVRISQKNIGSPNTEQYYCLVPRRYRLDALMRFITTSPDFYGFIFCQTKIETADLADKLSAKGYPANALHGDMNQANRNRVIKAFKNKKFSILVATDVAARGIDVSDVTHVINYQLPDDLESYVHRIGRTGRAGKKGTAITLIGNRESSMIKVLQKRFSVTINPIEIPSVMVIVEKQIEKAGSFIESLEQKQLDKPHLQKLATFLEKYSGDQVNQTILALLDDKFFQTIDKTEINFKATTFEKNDMEAEVMINIGSQDGVEKHDILKYLMQDNTIQKKHLGKIRVIKKRSFIKISSDKAYDVINVFKGTHIKGRRVFACPVE